ncbi:MAG: hypothetical protein HYZ14_08115 [Bacteroidetes bacterium]|nr:hypothetical protein [Bacteroidota bacterium]
MQKLLYLITLLVCVKGYSQDVEIHNGAEFKIEKKKRVDGFVENNDNMLSLVTYSYKLFETADNRTSLIVLDEQLNFYNQFPVTLPTSDEGKITFRETKKFREQLYLISRQYVRGSGDLRLYASELDATNGALGTSYEIFTYNAREQGSLDRYDLLMSADSSKMALMIEYRTKKDEPVKTGFRVYDESLKTLWEADLVLPETDRNTIITDYLVDNSGNIHLVVRIQLDKAERDKNETNVRYKYALFSYFHESQTIKEYDLFLRNNYLTGLTIIQNKNNELIGSAFYSDDRATSGMLGFLNFRLDLATYEIKNSKMNDFDETFLKNFLTERQVEKGRGVRNFRTRNIFPTSDNGYAFVVEEFDYYVQTYTAYNPSTKTTETKTTERWMFGDVVVFYVSPEGETKETGILKKNQFASSTTQGYSGHGRDGYGTYHPARYWGISAMMKNDRIYIVYNDNTKNTEPDAPKLYTASNIKKCTTMLAIIGPGGEFSNSALFKSRDKAAKYKSALIPRFNYVFSDSEQVIVGGAANYLRFMKIKVK